MTCQKSAKLLHYYVLKQVFSWRNRKQSVYLMHYYVSKQVSSWHAKNSYVWCIITWKSRFSHDVPKRCKFDAILRGKAGFLMMRQNSYIWCIITWKSRFSHDAQKRCKFVAILRFEASFLMTHQKLLYLMHYYVEKQIFSWPAKKVQICCIITFRSRFSHDATVNKVYIWCIITFRNRCPHDAPKTLIFDALLRGKAGFLMTRQKGVNLMHYYVEKQVFSWSAKNSNI